MTDAVESVATAFPAFIGYTEKAATPGEPVWVASLAQYRSAFGGAGPDGFRLDAALRGFYANGGDDALVLSLGPYGPAAAADPAPLLAGLERVGRESRPTLLLFPDALRLTRADYHAVVRAMLAQCMALRDRMAILDLHGGGEPASWSVAGSAPLIADFRAAMAGQPGRSYGAVYHPWLVMPDSPAVPPSGAMAGLYARLDREQGVWKAPTNVAPAGVTDLTVHYLEPEGAALNNPADGVAVNAIRSFPGIGLRVWGGRTLDGNSNDYRYIPVRRLLIFVEQSLKRGLTTSVFEPNGPATWTKARLQAETFLTALWRQGAFQGATSNKAFFVKCDRDTMSQDDIDQGRLIMQVGVAPVRPAEFVTVNIAKLLGG